MGFLAILLPITSLVCLVGFIWLVRNAFRTSIGWGLAVLFLSPFSALFYAIKNWQDARKPFLVYSGSIAAGTAALVLVLVLGTMGGFEAASMANDMRNGELTDEGAAELMNGRGNRLQTSGMFDAQGMADPEQARGMLDQIGAEAEEDGEPEGGGDATDAGTRGPRISEPSPEPSDQIVAELVRLQAQELARERPAPVGRIGVNEADRYVGSKVTAVGTDGIEHTGKLQSADGNVLWLETYFSGGTFAVELKKSQIRSLEILGD